VWRTDVVDLDVVAVRASLSDPHRFGEIFERHHAVLWTYIARVAGRDAADDLAGEVFTVAFRRRDTFDATRGQVRSWLYGIATNLVHTRLRTEQRAARAFLRAATEPRRDHDPIESVDDAAHLADVSRRLQRALAALDRNDRELIVLFAWEQLSYVELADVLGVPIGTVRSRLSRARSRLRELLDGSGELLGASTDQDGT
jgi:RNA polymerase sigma factor (sigma-70 family)